MLALGVDALIYGYNNKDSIGYLSYDGVLEFGMDD